MTDQSNNAQFHASSFMQGHNAEYLEQLYAQYAKDQMPLMRHGPSFSVPWAMMRSLSKPKQRAFMGANGLATTAKR